MQVEATAAEALQAEKEHAVGLSIAAVTAATKRLKGAKQEADDAAEAVWREQLAAYEEAKQLEHQKLQEQLAAREAERLKQQKVQARMVGPLAPEHKIWYLLVP